jgi:hypothetical protein
MRRKGGGKEFIDNKGCRVAEVSDNRRKRKRKEGGTPRERGKANGAEGSRVPIKAWWFSETKKDIDQEINRKHKQRL